MLKPNGADPGPTVVWCGLPVATSLTADRGGERERERERERQTELSRNTRRQRIFNFLTTGRAYSVKPLGSRGTTSDLRPEEETNISPSLEIFLSNILMSVCKAT